jgi:hypothetical protein
MWRTGGALMSYNYNIEKAEACGDNEYWDVNAKAGQWQDVTQYVKVNTPGAPIGMLVHICVCHHVGN